MKILKFPLELMEGEDDEFSGNVALGPSATFPQKRWPRLRSVPPPSPSSEAASKKANSATSEE